MLNWITSWDRELCTKILDYIVPEVRSEDEGIVTPIPSENVIAGGVIFGTAYRSFGGEVEALSTPTICRPPDPRRHQLPAMTPDPDEISSQRTLLERSMTTRELYRAAKP